MYSGDPVEAGRAWVDVCYQNWKLNPADYYAPINEPGRNDPDGLTWLCNFYLGCMRRADELGVKLCVGEWSTGMPPISVAESQQIVAWASQSKSLVWDKRLEKVLTAHAEVVERDNIFLAMAVQIDYISIYTPMLQYAKAHGHVLGLHEYSLDGPMIGSPLCLRYRQLYNALPLNARPEIYITEAGPDAGYGLGYRGQAYVDVVGSYDLEVMKDAYVGGVALFKLGTGESNMVEVMPLLTQWVATHPTPQEGNGVLPMPFIFGVHSPASPGDVAASDIAGIQRAAKFNGYKFMTGDSPAHYQQIFALGISPANCVTRLFIDLSGQPKPTPAQFCDWMSLAINEAMAVGVQWFELLNEPNLTTEWPYSTDPHDFITWILQVISLLRAQHPGIKLVSPGLSPQPNTPQWWIDFGEHGVFDACDAVGAHVYWPNRATMLTQEQGLNFIPLLPTTSASKPLFITEYANNIAGDTDYEKGLQYVDWASYLQANYPTVTRAYLYVISSNTPAENTTRQTIVRNGVVSAIADGIHDEAFGTPTLFVFDHSHLDGGAADKSNPRVITMDGNHSLLVDFVEVTPPVQKFFLTVTVNPPGAGTYALNPPQPVDGYPAGTVVTVTFT